jgi:hypothetical protein
MNNLLTVATSTTAYADLFSVQWVPAVLNSHETRSVCRMSFVPTDGSETYTRDANEQRRRRSPHAPGLYLRRISCPAAPRQSRLRRSESPRQLAQQRCALGCRRYQPLHDHRARAAVQLYPDHRFRRRGCQGYWDETTAALDGRAPRPHTHRSCLLGLNHPAP